MSSSFCTGGRSLNEVRISRGRGCQRRSVPTVFSAEPLWLSRGRRGSAGLIHLMKTASFTGKPLDALRSVHDRMGQAERVLAIARDSTQRS